MIFRLVRATLASQASSYNGHSSSSSECIEVVDKMVNELCSKIDELQHQLDIKNGAVDRKFSNLIKSYLQVRNFSHPSDNFRLIIFTEMTIP